MGNSLLVFVVFFPCWNLGMHRGFRVSLLFSVVRCLLFYRQKQ